MDSYIQTGITITELKVIRFSGFNVPFSLRSPTGKRDTHSIAHMILSDFVR